MPPQDASGAATAAVVVCRQADEHTETSKGKLGKFPMHYSIPNFFILPPGQESIETQIFMIVLSA